MAHANSITTPKQSTGATPTTSPDHTTLSFVRIEYHGKRRQRLTNWFAIPDEDYAAGNARGYRVAAELMAWLQNQPNNYGAGLCVREVMAAAFAVLSESSSHGKPDRRGAAVTFCDAMAGFIQFAAQHSNHAVYLPAQAQRSADWVRESAQAELERNRATGQRLAAARKAKREAKAMEAGAA